MRQEILAVILALLVVGSLGVGYLAGGQMNVRMATSTATVTTTTTSFITANPGGPPPYANPIYLEPDAGPGYSCSPGPCWGGNLSTGIVFNCAIEAATSAGCETTVVTSYNPTLDYNMTIWYPAANDTDPLTNCRLLAAPDFPNTLQAWCQAVGSNSFVIAIQPPPIA